MVDTGQRLLTGRTHAHTNAHAHRAAHAYYAKSTCRLPLAAVVAQSASSSHNRYETGPSAVGDGKNLPKWCVWEPINGLPIQ